MRNELKKPKDQRNMYAMTIMLALVSVLIVK